MDFISFVKKLFNGTQKREQNAQDNFNASPEIDPLVQRVENQGELLSREFSPDINCLRYPRAMNGDFNALARRMHEKYKQANIADNDIPAIRNILEEIKKEDGSIGEAASSTLSDLDFVQGYFTDVELRIQGYDPEFSPIITRMHRDRGLHGDNVGTLLCAYTGAATKAAPTEDCSFYEMTEAGSMVFKLKSNHQGYRFQPCEMFRLASTGNTVKAIPLIHGGEHVPTPDSVPRMVLVARKYDNDII